MTTGQKTLLLVLSGLGIGVGSYFLFRKSNAQLKREMLEKTLDNEKADFLSILNKMSRQELLDTAEIMKYSENTPKSVIDKIDPHLKERLNAISEKYNIFT